MAKKEKQLCKWKGDDIDKEFKRLSDIVRNPQFICKNYGRVADGKNGCANHMH